MVRSFKFFHGYQSKMSVVWNGNHQEERIDVEQELTRIMSSQIAAEIDNDILNRLTSLINSGGNDDGGYLNYWMNIGGNRA